MRSERPSAPPLGARVLGIVQQSREPALSSAFEAAGIEACWHWEPARLLELVERSKPQVVLLDAELADSALAEHFARVRTTLGCGLVLLSSALSGSVVMLAEQCGADTIMALPLDLVVFRRYLQRELRRTPALSVNSRPARLPGLIMAGSAPMQETWRLVLLAAQSDSSVILSGETGTGKEVLAHALHRFSARRHGPFIAVNCAAIPEALLESELLGHEKGSFTGASAQRRGRFELAHGGTLFLDEIGELPLALQVKLLRVLQERSFERVGGSDSIAVDVRVIAATHKELQEEVRQHHFRPDLFYRLNVLAIRVPPLRTRKSDILDLWHMLIAHGCSHEGRSTPTTSSGVQRLLLRHDWPGNIRELYNVVQHALMVATGDTITVADLPDALWGAPPASTSSDKLVGMTLKEVERSAILQTYAALGSVAAAALVLDVSPRKMHYRLKQFRQQGILREDER
ncbi:MAG TPA: sigma-54 dependent transcriptional regulator [Polyangiales bacterium]|nr:sigma-54 dependent transcriptional regulator [Polyangiales bacterium]